MLTPALFNRDTTSSDDNPAPSTPGNITAEMVVGP
jgi:hypothetical protein